MPSFPEADFGDGQLVADCSLSPSGDRKLNTRLRAINEDPGSILKFDHDLAGPIPHHACNCLALQHLSRAGSFVVKVVLGMIHALRLSN